MNASHKDSNAIKGALHRPMYFDFSAATPVHPKVLEVMMPYFTDDFYNPSALYQQARSVKEVMEKARHDVAQLLGVRASEILFTAGGSESISLAINGVMRTHDYRDGAVVISDIEHDAVRNSAQQYSCETVGVDSQGMIIVEDLKKILEDHPSVSLVSLLYVSNEIGTVQRIQDVSTLIRSINKRRKQGGLADILLHIDASQAPLYVDCHPSQLGVDLMTLNGGKIYGPKQSGILYVRSGVALEPLIKGGGQEFGLRSGTENVAFSVGITKALELALGGRDNRVRSTTSVRDYLIEQLEAVGGTLYGHRTKRIANNVLVGFDGADNEELLIKLDNLGFAVAIGSACHASKGEPSRVLRALGLSDRDARSTLRFSINEYTTKKDCDALINAIKESL